MPAQNTATATNKSANQISVNQDSLTIQDFSKRVDEYREVAQDERKQVCLPLNPETSASEVKQYQASLAQKHPGRADSHRQARRRFHSSSSPAFQKIDRDTFPE